MPNSNTNRPSTQTENLSTDNNIQSTRNETARAMAANENSTVDKNEQLNEQDETPEVEETTNSEKKTEPAKKSSNRLAWLPMVSFRNEEADISGGVEKGYEANSVVAVASSNASSSSSEDANMNVPTSREPDEHSEQQNLHSAESREECKEDKDNRVPVSDGDISEKSSRCVSMGVNANTTKRKRYSSNGYNSETGLFLEFANAF